jgi:5'-methylthioadenosine phosphorylase
MFVIVDQFVDRTFARAKTFFDEGIVAHVSMAHPVCPRLGHALEAAMEQQAIRYVCGGTYLAMEGPQFSTLAESELYRTWNCDVIGMTNMPEAKLAREAELCYASVAMVTDYDCWHADHEAVSVDLIVKTLLDNAERARELVTRVAPEVATFACDCAHGCSTALDHAIITHQSAWDPARATQLEAILRRVRSR